MEASQTDTKVEFCRVMCLEEGAMYVWVRETGNVYVKNVEAGLEIEPLDTVVMEYAEDDLQEASGVFADFWGEEETYSYILENPVSIRLTRPEEPTYG